MTFLDILAKHGLGPTLASDSREIIIHCVLCDHPVPKLYVNATTGRWICFHCEESGGPYKLCREVLGLDHFEAMYLLDKLKDHAQTPGFQRQRELEEEIIERPIALLPEEYHPLTERGAPGEELFWRYLDCRGVTEEDVARYGIGFCLRGWYRYRVIVPVRTNGILYTFVARTVVDDEKRVLYPKGARPSHALFGYDQLDPTVVRPTLVEGVFDALRLGSGALATLGTNFSVEQRDLLVRKNIRHVLLLWDGDEPGRHGAAIMASRLQAAGFDVRVALLPEGIDPASASVDQIATAMHNRRPPESYLSEHLNAKRLDLSVPAV